jgi:adenylate cyclase class 2
MQIEYEAKFIIDVDAFRSLLAQCGALQLIPRRLMKRQTYDLGAHAWARVRDEGTRITMTVKQLLDGNKIDGMAESEIVIDDFDKGGQLLKSLGLRQKSYQENYREEWQLLGCQVSIDTWPGLPVFAEIEGPSAAAVHQALSLLGFNPDDALFGSIDLLYQRFLGISPEVFNRMPSVTFSTIFPNQ